MECGNMGLFDRGVQMLLTTVGAFAAFSLMTIAVGTDYWLYSRGVCRSKSMSENETSKKNEEVMTHSGLWRTCCLEGKRSSNCSNFPNMVSFEADRSHNCFKTRVDGPALVYFSSPCFHVNEILKTSFLSQKSRCYMK